MLCTDSLPLASWPPSEAFPRGSLELDRAYSACLAASERHDRDASDRLLLTRALTHENPLRRVLPTRPRGSHLVATSEACASCSPRGLGSTASLLATFERCRSGVAKSVSTSLDLPIREAGETRVSRRAYSLRRTVMAYVELCRLPRGHGSIAPLTFRHPPRFSDSRLDASLRFFEDGLDRFHHRHRDAPAASATRKAFPR